MKTLHPIYGKFTKEEYEAQLIESDKFVKEIQSRPALTRKESEQLERDITEILKNPVVAKVMQDVYDRATANQTPEEKAEEEKFIANMLEREEQERLDALIDDDLGKAA